MNSKSATTCQLCIFFLAVIAMTNAAISNDILSDQKGYAKVKCESSYSLMCLKLDILSLIDKISTKNNEYNIASGVTIIREQNQNKTQNAKIFSELARAFPDSPEKRLNGFIVAKVQDLLQSYSLKLQLVSDETMSQFESRKGGGGGGLGGGKDKKGYGGMMAMAMMMKGTMMAMGLAALAALAGKALLTGMMALTMAGIVGLKSLSGKDDKKTTYEIISKPVYTQSHSHSTGHSGGGGGGHGSHEDGGQSHSGYGYGRSFQLPESVKA